MVVLDFHRAPTISHGIPPRRYRRADRAVKAGGRCLREGEGRGAHTRAPVGPPVVPATGARGRIRRRPRRPRRLGVEKRRIDLRKTVAGRGRMRAAGATPSPHPPLPGIFSERERDWGDGGAAALNGGGSRPVSRVLSGTAIPLGCASPRTSSDLPGGGTGRTMAPLFGLAPGGVCRAAGVATVRGALLPHRFTLAGARRRLGGLFSVALSVGSRPPGVTWHPALWSPDFPPRPRGTQRLSGRLPASVYHRTLRPAGLTGRHDDR